MLTLLLAGVATAVASNRNKAEEALTAVSTDPKNARLVRVQVAKAKDALDRGTKARQTGDEAHAERLDALALQWAMTAVDLTRTAELEARAAEVEKETAELEARASRALTMIEQTVARRGKAMQRLKELGVDLAPGEPAVPATSSTGGGSKP